MNRHQEIRHAFDQQSKWCSRLGSPFTALLMDVLGTHLDESTRTGRAVLNWEGTASALHDAVPLRLAGALHAQVRAGHLPALARLYPPNPLPNAAALADAVAHALEEADEVLLDWLQFTPQTNETARSAVLYAGFLAIAQRTQLPLQLFELGASAGLNLIADRYAYRLGGEAFGQAGSPLTLAPNWQGPPPPHAAVDVTARRGCDLSPLDVHNAHHRERLVSYVWPDQPERLARVEAAIAVAQREPLHLDARDAASWVEATLPAEPVAGTARVLFHSIAWQYFPQPDQERITAHMHEAGARATADAPLAWLSFEQASQGKPRLSLTPWPGGHSKVLAHADAHVRQVTWL